MICWDRLLAPPKYQSVSIPVTKKKQRKKNGHTPKTNEQNRTIPTTKNMNEQNKTILTLKT